MLLLYTFSKQFDVFSDETFVTAINSFYLREIRLLHRPVQFFEAQGAVADQILELHRNYRGSTPSDWSTSMSSENFINKSSRAMYYALAYWKTPLALLLMLERDCKDTSKLPTTLIDYLEFWSSAKEMCYQLKAHPHYGFREEISDKVSLLFARCLIVDFQITRRNENSWKQLPS